MQKYFIITFGCQMNNSDSERIAAVLEKKGYKLTLNINKADLIIVNMCSVRQTAVDRIFGLVEKIKKLKSSNLNLKTVLTGCILKKDRKTFSNLFDEVVDVKDLQNPNIAPKYFNKIRAFLPISNGCNNFCSYCVVPYTRGKLVCRDHKKILEEARGLIKKGFKELWLLGQNVNDYSSPTDKSIDFLKLLKMVNNLPGDFKIFFMSPNPKNFSEKLIGAMKECKKFSKFLNLPVQSGDNEILKKMNRPYSVQQYVALVKKIRKAIPGINLSTDVIVGFPGETKKQFENSAKLFREVRFDMAYLNKYSPRPGTAAAKLKDNVPKKEKDRRFQILNEILKKTALENNKKFIGKTVEVLIEDCKNGFCTGKSWHYKTVKLKGPKNLIGKFKKVKIIGATPWGLKTN